MAAITITDLENAKTDVDHIADIANSEELEATDRLGNTKPTLAGLRSRYPLGYAKSYANTTQGLAGTTNGEQFLVRTADEYTFQNYYNNAGAATLIGTLYLASGERFQQNSDSAAHAVVTDADGNVLVSVHDDGVHDHTSGEDVLLTGAAEEIESTGSSEALMSLEDVNGRTVLAINAAGRPLVPGIGAFLDNTCSADIVKAKEYESFGDTSKSNYFYDKAKSSLAQRVRFLRWAIWSHDDTDVAACRHPVACMIDDTHGLVFFSQRNVLNATSGENFQRVAMRSFTIDPDTGSFSASATTVIYEPDGWNDPTTGGYAAQPSVLRLPSDDANHPNRVVLLYNQIVPDHKLADTSYERAIFEVHSDDDGATWSAPNKVLGSAQIYNTLSGLSTGIPGDVPPRNGAINGCGNCLIRIPSGPYAGRLVCTLYAFSSTIGYTYLGSMYSDDGGVTWIAGTLHEPIGALLYDESGITYCADGSIAMFLRNDDAASDEYIHPGVGLMRSVDGGVSWSYIGHVSSAGSTAVAVQTLTASLAGSTGFPKILIPGSTQTIAGSVAFDRYRDKFEIRLSYDNGASFVAKSALFHENDNIGYGHIQRLSNGRYLMVFETWIGNSAINAFDSIGILVFNEAEIFHNSELV